jgi:hypothetical protein
MNLLCKIGLHWTENVGIALNPKRYRTCKWCGKNECLDDYTGTYFDWDFDVELKTARLECGHLVLKTPQSPLLCCPACKIALSPEDFERVNGQRRNIFEGDAQC